VAIQITVWIQRLFSRFVTIGRYEKWLTDKNLLLVLIHQMAALVRHALAEVCTVPVLLVVIFFTARRYTTRYVHALALCLSIRPSQVGVLPELLNIGSRKQRRTIDHEIQGFYCQRYCLAKDLGNIPMGSPLTGRQVHVAYEKISTFDQ